MPSRKYVEFYDGRRFFIETRRVEVENHNVDAATEMCHSYEFGFAFGETTFEMATTDSGQRVETGYRSNRTSGVYYMQPCEVMDLETVKARNELSKSEKYPKGQDDILIWNMEMNNWPKVIHTRNGITQTFGENDVVVNKH